MIEKTEMFSHQPFGEVWLCSECEHIHLRYGNIVVNLDRKYAEQIVRKSLGSLSKKAHCDECNKIHFNCGSATLHMSPASHKNLLDAIGRFLHMDNPVHYPAINQFRFNN